MAGKVKPTDPKPGAGKRIKAPEDRRLSTKMKALADAWLVPGTTQRDAALIAGYPETSAASQAAYVMELPQVKRYIAERQKALQDKHDVTLDRVIREFAKIGFANMADYLTSDEDDNPRFLGVSKISRDKMGVITELTLDVRKEFEGRGEDREQVATVDRIKFKLADKVKALDALGRHLGMFPKDSGEKDEGKLEVTVEGGLPDDDGRK